jgi:predicted peptidase
LGLISQVFETTITRRLKLPYLVYLPQDFEAGGVKQWPLVFFLHGAGERGSDLTTLSRQGLVRLVQEGQQFPFIMVAPQCPEDTTWDRNLEALDCLLDEVLRTYPVDTKRIYLTGLSMGGYGTWHWAASQPRAFAALVPICGGAMPLTGFPERVTVLKDIPIWVFHGADDQVVPVSQSEQLVRVLESINAPVRFTKYAGVGHNSWNRAYAEPELIPWLLEQTNVHFHLEKGNGCA